MAANKAAMSGNGYTLLERAGNVCIFLEWLEMTEMTEMTEMFGMA